MPDLSGRKAAANWPVYTQSMLNLRLWILDMCSSAWLVSSSPMVSLAETPCEVML